MILLDVFAQCQDHDPPHRVDINTDHTGGEWPELPCGGMPIAYEVEGECDCGENLGGEYFPDEDHRMPDHECDYDEDEDEDGE